LRNTTSITAGQVFTIEPGFYFIPELLAPLHGPAAGSCDINWGAIERLSPFGGIRIEDNIVVREHGAENLTRGDNRFVTP
jgi:Xaa-Pro dipeptidase